jgi:hypothetical protein
MAMDIIKTVERERRHMSLLSVISIRTGLVVLASLIGYFFIMKMLGLYQNMMLRAFNVVFLASGIWIALNRYRKMIGRKIDYFMGMRIGVLITLIATIPFAVFVGIYLALDTSFMTYIILNHEFGPYLSPLVSAIGVAAEGLSSGFILTYVIMPHFKKQ